DFNLYLYEFIIDNLDSKLKKSGVLLGEKKLVYTSFSDSELLLLYEEYSKISPPADFQLLINELTNRNLEITLKNSDKNFIDGVITIYVNKGITFNNGVGSQDIIVGSGFFIDKLGYAVTNYHVIESCVDPEYEGVSKLYIKLNDSKDKIPAKVIGWDPIMDLALIKVSVIPNFVYSFENVEISVGDRVTAVGSPGGLGSTVTKGNVSATKRRFLELGSVIQIDSAINPGNSGGPLINDDFLVTNIVFAGIEDFEGVNFAIPVRYLESKLLNLYNGNKIDHVWLGVGLTERKKHLEVIYIKDRSPGFYAGLQQGDIIESIDNFEFNTILDAQDYIYSLEENQIVELKYTRNSENYVVKMSLSKRPNEVIPTLIDSDSKDNLYRPLFGMDIEFTGRILWDKEYLVNDVYPGTIADELELQTGDIIKIKDWEYNENFEVVTLLFSIQSKNEGFWEKSIQISAPISTNLFI
ncbi:MAG: trypsin-like peptidase domain-containing protein, partial [Spirochaetales bacterium]|nr:trypsin-like peptidase domain-containing protein [Spirochaetales bacterium]